MIKVNIVILKQVWIFPPGSFIRILYYTANLPCKILIIISQACLILYFHMPYFCTSVFFLPYLLLLLCISEKEISSDLFMIWLIACYYYYRNNSPHNCIFIEVISSVVHKINTLQILLLETCMSLDVSVSTRDKT